MFTGAKVEMPTISLSILKRILIEHSLRFVVGGGSMKISTVSVRVGKQNATIRLYIFLVLGDEYNKIRESYFWKPTNTFYNHANDSVCFIYCKNISDISKCEEVLRKTDSDAQGWELE